jgi:hypothetical protein
MCGAEHLMLQIGNRAELLNLSFLLISQPPSSGKSSGTSGSKSAETNQEFHKDEHVARKAAVRKIKEILVRKLDGSLFGRQWHKLTYSSNIRQEEDVRAWTGHVWQRVGCSEKFSSTFK